MHETRITQVGVRRSGSVLCRAALAFLLTGSAALAQTPVLVAPDPSSLVQGNALVRAVPAASLPLAAHRAVFDSAQQSLARADSAFRRRVLEDQRLLIVDDLALLKQARKRGFTSILDSSFQARVDYFSRPSTLDSLAGVGFDPYTIGTLWDSAEVDLRGNADRYGGSQAGGFLSGWSPFGAMRDTVDLESLGPKIQETVTELANRVKSLYILDTSGQLAPLARRELEMAYEAREKGQWDRAAGHFETLLAVSPESELLTGYLREARERSGRVTGAEARKAWRSFLRPFVGDGDILKNAGPVEFEHGGDTAGETGSVLDRARNLHDQGDQDAAEQALQAWLKAPEKPKGARPVTRGEVLEALGDLRARDGDTQGAVDAWLKVPEEDARYTEARLKAAWQALERGNHAAARELAAEVQERAPGSVEAVEARTLNALALGGGDSVKTDLVRFAALDDFAAAARHLVFAREDLRTLDSLKRATLAQDSLLLFVRYEELASGLRRLITSAAEAYNRSRPAGLDPLPEQPEAVAIVPFEARQLERAAVREAELDRLHVQLLGLAAFLDSCSALPEFRSHESARLAWLKSRVAAAHSSAWSNAPVSLFLDTRLPSAPAWYREDARRRERFRRARGGAEPLPAIDRSPLATADRLLRCRDLLRTRLALGEEAPLLFDPSTIAAKYREGWIERMEARLRLLSEASLPGDPPEGWHAAAMAQLHLWIGELERLDALDRKYPGDLKEAREVWQVLADSPAPPDIVALALDRIAAVSLQMGGRRDLTEVEESVRSLLQEYSAFEAAKHGELLLGERWLSGRRPDFDRAAAIFRRASARAGTTYRREALYLEGWSRLRMHDPDRLGAVNALDLAARLPLPMPSDARYATQSRIAGEAVRELASAFAPPYVQNLWDGFGAADQYFHEDWDRVRRFGFEFYRLLGDLYLHELDDPDAASYAYTICSTRFPRDERRIEVMVSRLELLDRVEGDPVKSFMNRIALLRAWMDGGGTGGGTRSDSIRVLVRDQLKRAVNLAAQQALKGAEGNWAYHLDEAVNLYIRHFPDVPDAPELDFLRASTFDKLREQSTRDQTPEFVFEHYWEVANRWSGTPVEKRALERAYVLAVEWEEHHGPIGSTNGFTRRNRLIPTVALKLADRFPQDPRTPSLLLNAGLALLQADFGRYKQEESDSLHAQGAAVLDTLVARYPDATATAKAVTALAGSASQQQDDDATLARTRPLLEGNVPREVRKQAAAAYAEAAYRVGKKQQAAGDTKKALSTWQTALEFCGDAPYIPTLLYETGLLAGDLGKPDVAREAFERIDRSYPDSPYAASAAYNLAVTLGQLQVKQLVQGTPDITPAQIAGQFMQAYEADPEDNLASNFLVHAAENYRLAAQDSSEYAARKLLWRRFPDTGAQLANLVRLEELAYALKSHETGTFDREIIRLYPNNPETVIALVRRGVSTSGDADRDLLERAVALQGELARAGKPGHPGWADLARVAMVDMQVLGDAYTIRDLVGPIGNTVVKGGTAEYMGKVNSYKKYESLPSAVSILALGHAASREASLAITLAEQDRPGMNASRVTAAEAVGYDKRLETIVPHFKNALLRLEQAEKRLALLRARYDSLAAAQGSGEGWDDPFGFASLEWFVTNPSQFAKPLPWEKQIDAARAKVLMEMADAVQWSGYLFARVPDEGRTITEQTLYRAQVLQDIIQPRMLSALPARKQSITLAPEEKLRQKTQTSTSTYCGWADPKPLGPEVYQPVRIATHACEQEWKTSGRNPEVERRIATRLDSLRDLQSAAIALFDASTAYNLAILDSLGRDSLVLPVRDVLEPLWTHQTCSSVYTFDLNADLARGLAREIRGRGTRNLSAIMQDALLTLDDLEHGWRDAALRQLETVWATVDSARLDPGKRYELMRALVLADPARYASLLDLPEQRNTAVLDASWTFNLVAGGETRVVTPSFEAAPVSEGMGDAIEPPWMNLANKGDRLVAFQSVFVDGLPTGGEVEIRSNGPYELYWNDAYLAEGMGGGEESDRWRLQDHICRCINKIRVEFTGDGPYEASLRITWTQVPPPPRKQAEAAAAEGQPNSEPGEE